MNPAAKLESLLALPGENEVVEFKEAKNGYDFTKLGKYFSALCNEANLKRRSSAWLGFGVNNHRQVVGSNYRLARKDLDHLKEEIADKTTNRISFVEIHEVEHSGRRVLLLEIPAAPKGLPVAFEGHYYGRDGEALSPLNLEEIERIRAQSGVEDWSAAIVPEADIADLDEEALAVARRNFKSKFPDKAAEVDGWDDATFLNKAKLTIKGRITRAALLLLPPVLRGECGGGVYLAGGGHGGQCVPGRAAIPGQLRPAGHDEPTAGRPQGGRGLAYAGLGQVAFDGVLYRQDRAGAGQPDDSGHHRPQRPRRSALRHLCRRPAAPAPGAGAGGKPRAPEGAAEGGVGESNAHEAGRAAEHQAVAVLRHGTHRLRWLREGDDAQGIAVGIRGGVPPRLTLPRTWPRHRDPGAIDATTPDYLGRPATYSEMTRISCSVGSTLQLSAL